MMIPTLIGVTLLTFLLFNVFGGDPAQRFAGKHANSEQVEKIKEELGLDKSRPLQYLFFLKQIVTFDFGRSWSSKQKISTIFSDGISATLSLTVVPFIAAVVFCIIVALIASYFRARALDKFIVFICLTLMSSTSLLFIIGFQYFFAYKLGVFPISGWDPDWINRWQYLFLPWLILFILDLGPSILVYRSVIMDEIFRDYVRTARAKGIADKSIYLKHILKNALIPIITIVVIQIPFLITGAVLVESFFGIPGLGGTLIKSLQDSDFPVIKAMTVITAILYMFFNLLSDILYSIVDPRVKLR
jgi:peptide/nickel transport system permease protein